MQINLAQLIFQAVNFGLLLFIMTKFLYKPVLKLLEDRNKKIESGLKAAETNLHEKEKIEELKQKQLIKAEQEATLILEAARRQAEHVGKDIVTEAKISAQAEVKKEYQLLEEKLQAERQNLQSEVANLVIDTTKTVLADTLTKQHQQAILNSQIGTLKKLRVRPS